MKEFFVDVDITMSKTIWLEAENETEAKEAIKKMIAKDPFYYASNADSFVNWVITDIGEEAD